MFKGLTGFASLMRHAHELPARLQAVNHELQAQQVEGEAADGRVRVAVNGVGEVLEVEIAPELLAPEQREALQGFVSAAMNEALPRARKLHVEAMRGMAGDMDLNLPGMQQAFDTLAGGAGKGP